MSIHDTVLKLKSSAEAAVRFHRAGITDLGIVAVDAQELLAVVEHLEWIQRELSCSETLMAVFERGPKSSKGKTLVSVYDDREPKSSKRKPSSDGPLHTSGPFKGCPR